jgi:hypothetical protein
MEAQLVLEDHREPASRAAARPADLRHLPRQVIERDGDYGAGDGTTYVNAGNGLEKVDWQAMSASDPAQLWLCGGPGGPGGFMTVFVNWSYFETAPQALRRQAWSATAG